MIGQSLIPRRPNGFEIAHRLQGDEDRIEVTIGTLFNELYWDLTADDLRKGWWRHRDVRRILRDQGAQWLLRALPKLVNKRLSPDQLRALAATSA
jgi:hypothetical protein